MSDIWKALERRHAKRMGGIRILRGTDYSVSLPDGETAADVWDAKHRKSIATVSMFRRCEALYRRYCNGRRFHLVIHEHGKQGDFVLLRAEDFADLVKREQAIEPLRKRAA